MQTHHVHACVCECGYVAILLRRILFAQTDNIFAVALKRPYKELLPVYVRAYICMSILFVCVCVCLRVSACMRVPHSKICSFVSQTVFFVLET